MSKEPFMVQKCAIRVELRSNNINVGNANQQKAVELDYWPKRNKQSIDLWLILIPALKCDV
jgi:hypothetical protein